MEPFLPAHINLCFYLGTSDLCDVWSFSLAPSHFLCMSCGKVAVALQSASQIPDTHACIFYCSHMLLNSLRDYRFIARQMGFLHSGETDEMLKSIVLSTISCR